MNIQIGTNITRVVLIPFHTFALDEIPGKAYLEWDELNSLTNRPDAVWLTKAMLDVLKEMIAAEARDDLDGAEIVQDGLCYLGLRRIHPGTITRLLQLMAISDRSDTEIMRRYRINDTGRAIVNRPEIVREIMVAVSRHQAFTIRDNQVVALDR